MKTIVFVSDSLWNMLCFIACWGIP